MSKTLCFTGHRPQKLFGYNVNEEGNQLIVSALSQLIESAIKKDVKTFITGMALGIDQWAADIVLSYKEVYPDIKLIAAVPHKGHGDNWKGILSKIKRDSILESCDEVVMVSNEPYTNWCMQKRNEYMVNRSDYIIAVWDGTSGGTGNCVKYAEKVKKPIVCLHPKELTVSKL